MSSGIDWNGNGKCDSVDVGIDISIREEGQEKPEDKRKPKRNGGCLAAAVMMPFTILAALIKMFIGEIFNG